MTKIVIDKIRLKRGTFAHIPTLYEGEPYFAEDTNELWIGTGNGNKRIIDSTVLADVMDAYTNFMVPSTLDKMDNLTLDYIENHSLDYDSLKLGYVDAKLEPVNASLTDVSNKQAGVLHIEQYINLVPNRNVTTDTTQWDWTTAWNQAITDLQGMSGEFKTLFLGGRNYKITSSTTVTFPLSLQGIYNARKALSNSGGTKLVDASTGSAPFINYDGLHSPANRIWGGIRINDIHIDGQNALHDCISMTNTAWEMRIDGLYIENFQGSALITDTVYDSVITALTIYKCGGMTDANGNIRYALQMDSSVSDCTNAIHFFGLHIECCRYMTKLVKVRHVQFVGSKWECWEPLTVTADLTNPFIWIDTASLETTFNSCMFVTNSAIKWVSSGYATNVTQAPYFIDVMGSATVDVGAMATIFDSCQFTNPPSGSVGYGAKVMRSGNGCFKVNNCHFDYLTGGDYGIYLKNDSHITNSKIGVQVSTDGKALGIRLDRSNALGNTLRVYNPTFVTIAQDTAILTITGLVGDNRFYGFTNKVVGDSNSTDSIFRRKKNIIKVNEALFKSLHGLASIDYANVTLDMAKFETGHIVFEFDNSFTLKRIIGGFDCDEVIIHNNKTGTITLAFNVNDVANSKLVLSKNVNAVLNPEELLALKFTGWQWMETGRRSIT